MRDPIQRRDAELIIVHALVAAGNVIEAARLMNGIESGLEPLKDSDRVGAVFGVVMARIALYVAAGDDRDVLAGLPQLDLTYPQHLESRSRLMLAAQREDVEYVVAALAKYCRSGGEWFPEYAAEELAARGFAERLLEATRERGSGGRLSCIRIGIASGVLRRLGLRRSAIWEVPVWASEP